VKKTTLDLTSRESDECRKTTLDVVKEDPRKTRKLFYDVKAYGESTLIPWIEGDGQESTMPSYKVIPNRMDWNAVRKAYELQPSGYEDMLFIDGMGPATVRGLSLISEMIYGSAPSWSDPVRMTFAFGGKDGVPFPVPRKEYDEAIKFMEQALNDAKLGRRDRVVALRRLRKFAPPVLHAASQGS
ncbi:MAG: DUF763 domain-containing protein, partial [Candidatus Thorarchaeota archaeon]|jgi:hypothetical protein